MFFSFGNGFGFNVQQRSGSGYVDLLPDLVVSPTFYDYGEHDTGTNTDYIFTLTNLGNEVAEDITVAVTGTGFSLLSSAGPFNVAADGGTTNITVRFSPSAAGTASGSLTLSWPNRDDIVVGLSGEGVVVGGTTLLYEETGTNSGLNNQYSLVGGRIAPVSDVSVYTVDVYVSGVAGTPAAVTAKIFPLGEITSDIICALQNPSTPLGTSEPLTISTTGWHTFTFTTPVPLTATTNGYAVAFGPSSFSTVNYLTYANGNTSTNGDGRFQNRWNASTGAYVTGVARNATMKVWV